MTRSHIRQRAEDMIEQLIGLLDQIDGDADFEPSLGFGMKNTRTGILFLCNDLEDPQCSDKPRRSKKRRAA